MNNAIVFIHGFAGGDYEYRPIISFLQSRTERACYAFLYKEKFGQISFEILADQLHAFIITNIHEPVIDIVALSQGGIIARQYIGRYHDRKIRRCITLCTPHKGSLLAYLGFFRGIKELRPSSPLLHAFDCKNAEYFAVYNPLDLMVFPGWFAKLDCAKENKRIIAPLHQLTFWRKQTLNYILRVLTS